MIVIEQENDLVKATIYGELTLVDIREFEEAVNEELHEFPNINLLFDLSNMSGFTVDAALEELQFNRKHIGDYQRVAVVSTDQWLSWFAWLANIFTGADVQHFAHIDEARNWLS